MNKKNLKWLTAALCSLLLLNGCAMPKKSSDALDLDTRLYQKESSCKSTEYEELKNTCTEGLKEYEVLEKEKKFYPSYTDGGSEDYRPELAVSLSGGGQRAASTAIGFLYGLDWNRVLEKADLLSTVSGGSYAGYWFMTKLYGAKNYKAEANLINDSPEASRFKSLFDRYFIFCRKDPLVKCKSNDCTALEDFCDLRKDNPPPPLDPEDLTVQAIQARKEAGETWGRFQQHVSYHGNLLTTNQETTHIERPKVWLELATRGLFLLPWIPVHWAAAGVFDSKVNNNISAHVYRYGIEHEYGLYPKKRGAEQYQEFYEAKPFIPLVPSLPLRLKPMDIPISMLVGASGDDSKSTRLPFWIINSTAAYGGGWKFLKTLDGWMEPFGIEKGPLASFSNNLYDTIYEFTPVARGSLSYGYFPNDAHNCLFNKNEDTDEKSTSGRIKNPDAGGKSTPSSLCESGEKLRFLWEDRFLKSSTHSFFTAPDPLTLSQIVAISGAAIDNFNFGGNLFLDVFNGGLGQYIDNPAQPNEVRRQRQILPFPLYLIDRRATHDIHGPSIYLSDGGHSGDNLGIYSALKRRPRNLIVLDAEHESNSDGLAIFESLQKVVCRLKIERDVEFTFLAESEESQNQQLVNHLNHNPCGTPSLQDPPHRAKGASPNELDFNVRKVAMPYFRAKITVPCFTNPQTLEVFGAPCPKGTAPDEATETEMVYVKLALDDRYFKPVYDDNNQCSEGERYQCETQLFDVKHEGNTEKKLRSGKRLRSIFFHWLDPILGYPYPHQGTDDFDFSKAQFAAYRSLGFDLGKCITYSNGTLEIVTPCDRKTLRRKVSVSLE